MNLKMVTKALERATPESQGIASSAVLQFVEAAESRIHEFHSFMLLRHGKVVAEGWWSPYRRELPHMLFSLSKSFTSTAVGLAISEGRFSLDDLVLPFFPDAAPAQPNEHLAAMRVRHLLSMSTGQVEDTMPAMVDRPDFKWTKGFFEVPVLHPPGTHFLYNTGATYMLSAIVQQTTGMKLVDYLKPRLFEPLGIENPVWETSPEGINMGGFGLNTTTEDIARFGQLYLQNGVWEGEQRVPEAWVREATAFQVANGEDVNNDWAQGYGYQFWRCRHDAYRGDGAFGQYCVIMPEQDAVLAITAGLGDMQEPLNLVWDILLPAMGESSLPDDTSTHEALRDKLNNLAIPPLSSSTISPTATRVSGRTYRVDPNPLNVETIAIDFTESGSTTRLKTARGEQTLPCGYGVWQKGMTTLFNEPWILDPSPFVASGAWTDPDTYTTVIRLYETPFLFNVVCRFTGEDMTIDTRVNVGFQPPETITLSAHAE